MSERELRGENYKLRKENKVLLEENLKLIRMAAHYQNQIVKSGLKK